MIGTWSLLAVVSPRHPLPRTPGPPLRGIVGPAAVSELSARSRARRVVIRVLARTGGRRGSGVTAPPGLMDGWAVRITRHDRAGGARRRRAGNTVTAASLPPELTEFAERVAGRLHVLGDGLPEPLRSPVTELARRPGKRLRSTLLGACARLGTPDPERVVRV